MTEQHRTFETGATRDTSAGKFDYEGFISPLVMRAFGTYMNFHRELADGSTRDSDNWQKGMPHAVYMKSAWRHFFDWWAEHRGFPTKEGMIWAMLGLMFNLQGYLHTLLERNPGLLDEALYHNTLLRNKQRMEARRTEQAAKAFTAPYDHRTPFGDRVRNGYDFSDRPNGCAVEERHGTAWPAEGEPRECLDKLALAGDPGSSYPKAGRFA